MRKRWIVVSVVLAALAIAVTGGAIMAQDAETKKTFAGRVAEILGLEEQAVSDAMKQAKDEMRDEAMRAKFDALVEKGLMTQEDADAYIEWMESKPDVDFGGGFGRGRHKRGGFGRRHGWGGWSKYEKADDADASGA